MIRSANQVFDDALRLPQQERAALAARLIDSLDTTVDHDAQSAWEVEIQRRVTELDNGTVKPIPWSDARKMIVGDEPAPG